MRYGDTDYEELETSLDAINEVGKEYDLNINTSKTKLMIFSRHDNEIFISEYSAIAKPLLNFN